RMGRILRRKRPGIAARFVIMFAKDTLEDPANRFERDGFLDQIERIAAATGVFDESQLAALDEFLAVPGPAVVPVPELLERYERNVDVLATEARYAFLAFARPDPANEGELRDLDARLSVPADSPDAAPYLEVELAELPEIAKRRVEPKRLSTGQAALEISQI